MLMFCVMVTFALVISSNCDDEFQIVNTLQGPVRGHKSAKWNLYEFYGIPYATAPKGEDKFMAPLPPPTWTNTYDAVDKNIICPQNKITLQEYGLSAYYDESENCLVANILVSNTNDSDKPVFVYVHGGGYQFGSGTFLQPKELVEQGNIIAITFNYRLSVEGFLCLGTEKVPGNAGLKDMIALLRWVQQNIATFGGNPSDVTLGGYSAGSTAVDLLMLLDLSTELFQKVVLESGTSAALWAVQQDPIENAKKLAKSLNFDSSNITDLEHFFTTASYEKLTRFTFLSNKDTSSTFVPCVELDIGQERVLKENPLDILERGSFRRLPMLLGHTSAEGYLRGGFFEIWKDEMSENFADFLPADLKFENDTVKLAVAKIVKDFYFGSQPVRLQTAEAYLNYFGDISITYAFFKTVTQQAVAGNQNLYFYIYSFFDDSAVVQEFLPDGSLAVNAAVHCAQSYALNEVSALKDSSNETKEYKEIKQLLRTIWIHFIRTGKPFPDGSALIPGGWPPTSSDATPYMVLDNISHLSYHLDKYRYMFWDEIYAKHYRAPIPPYR